jgi:hypothetical protein
VDADTECTGALNGYLDGTIDEIMVYDVALTAAQIQADMNNQPVVPITAAPGQPVIAWAKFGQMSFAWDYADPRPSEFRLYVSAGQSSGCPGPIYTSVPGTSLTATVSHVPWGVTHSAQVSAFSTGESVCSDLVSGLPK